MRVQRYSILVKKLSLSLLSSLMIVGPYAWSAESILLEKKLAEASPQLNDRQRPVVVFNHPLSAMNNPQPNLDLRDSSLAHDFVLGGAKLDTHWLGDKLNAPANPTMDTQGAMANPPPPSPVSPPAPSINAPPPQINTPINPPLLSDSGGGTPTPPDAMYPAPQPVKDILNYGQTDSTGRKDNPSGDFGLATVTQLPIGNSGNNDDTHSVGVQALFDTIRAKALDDRLQGLLVASLFQDGGVSLGADGQFHQYADAVAGIGDRGIQFLNATMLSGQPDTLNYQRTTLTFNQSLPSDYTLATRTAFRSDGPTFPTYWATDVENIRSNTVDALTVQANNGTPVFKSDLNRYVTVFSNETATISTPDASVTLYQRQDGNTTYLGDTPPTVEVLNNGNAHTTIRNTYANGVVVERNVAYVDSAGNGVSLDNLPSNSAPRDYLASLYVQDTLSCSLFVKGPITTFGTAQSRLLAGLDAVSTDKDATDVLAGGPLPGAPDGLLHN